MTGNEFWSATPALKYIRAYARAKGVRVSPFALLLDVLARLSVAVPPHVVTPALAGGSYGGLNLFVAVVGASGDGKGLTERAARNLLPDVRGAVTAIPASGEGLPALFAQRDTSEDGDGNTVSELKCVNPRALLSVPEITTLGGTAKRVGSTLIPTLTSAYSGESLGAFNKSEGNRLTVPEHGYRLSLVTGVQPANSDVLLGEAATGLPQRFLWADCTDMDAPEHAEDKPANAFPFDTRTLPADMGIDALSFLYTQGGRYNMLDHGDKHYPLTELQYPQCVYDAVEADSYRRLTATRGDPLDAHRIGILVKLSALLMLLDNRGSTLGVGERDWRLAEWIYEQSKQVRDRCIRQAENLKRDSRSKAIELDADARALADSRKLESAKTSILNYLNRHDPAHQGVVGWKIRQSLGRNSRFAYQAIEELETSGRLDRLNAGQETKSALWSLPVQ